MILDLTSAYDWLAVDIKTQTKLKKKEKEKKSDISLSHQNTVIVHSIFQHSSMFPDPIGAHDWLAVDMQTQTTLKRYEKEKKE